MNYEGNEECIERELIKTEKLIDLVLEEHELKEDFLRSNSPKLDCFFGKVTVLKQIMTGFSEEDCEGFIEVATEQKITRQYSLEIQKAVLEGNFEKEKND